MTKRSTLTVIPGRCEAANPESITPNGGYGFRIATEPVIGPAEGRTRWARPE